MKQDSDNQPVTKKDLQDALEVFGRQLMGQMRQEMDEREKSIVGTLRGEMDERDKSMRDYMRGEMDERDKSMKAYIGEREESIEAYMDRRMREQEISLKAHTEDVVGHHSAEILQAIAEVVEPMGKQVKKHNRLLADSRKP